MAFPLALGAVKPKKEAGKDSPRFEKVEAKVISVLPDPGEKGWMVILAPKGENLSKAKDKAKSKNTQTKVLVIGVGDGEGSSILLAIHHKDTMRPLTHELFAKVLSRSKIIVLNALIHTMSDKTFYARLDFSQNGKKFSIDCRPSDGIALALRSSGKIYVLRKIFDEAGVDWPPSDGTLTEPLREGPL